MKAKEYLSQGIWLDQIIDSKLEQLESLKSLATKVTATFTHTKVSGGNDVRSPAENAIVKVIDLENEINADIDRLVDLKREILETINKVNDLNYRLLLEMRYISGKSWEEISADLGYERSWVFRVHGKALKVIEQKLKATKSN
ncbi:hypothetical protein SYNTR_0928 [Candidatus Syntrophocurvum alkaliphilum]|uniref:RNA polymerase sigma-70 region 4 domain-containing protein n=1 Tax=Candidatus Syntrophocurvum alkaliphilum TaxID=2293317 RepID=A0A6I6DJ84_9FIRM|nr:DUF1492 domain-containing protein [Candidatus Syntrophocurvum alkaliphilum]QGT99521.1 hypothetical protein SYNTR_0928 [Candidatus Syntrophocurvum alkaliphilum]